MAFLNTYLKIYSPATGKRSTLKTDNTIWHYNPWKYVNADAIRYKSNGKGGWTIERTDGPGYLPIDPADERYGDAYINDVENQAKNIKEKNAFLYFIGSDRLMKALTTIGSTVADGRRNAIGAQTLREMPEGEEKSNHIKLLTMSSALPYFFVNPTIGAGLTTGGAALIGALSVSGKKQQLKRVDGKLVNVPK